MNYKFKKFFDFNFYCLLSTLIVVLATNGYGHAISPGKSLQVVQPPRSEIKFTVQSVLAEVKGKVRKITGQLILNDANKPLKLSLAIRGRDIQLEGVSDDQAVLMRELLGLNDADISFISQSINPTGQADIYKVSGTAQGSSGKYPYSLLAKIKHISSGGVLVLADIDASDFKEAIGVTIDPNLQGKAQISLVY